LEGIQSAFEFLSEPEKGMMLSQSIPKALNSPYPAIAPFLLREQGHGEAL
jgi:hypothetical protein